MYVPVPVIAGLVLPAIALLAAIVCLTLESRPREERDKTKDGEP